ncbi:MAG: methyltransferase, partial [Ktedonobacteraceae bacterium]
PDTAAIHQQPHIPDSPAIAVKNILQDLWIVRAVHVAVKLGIADRCHAGPRSIEELAQETETNALSLYRLLRCLASVAIFAEVQPRVFVNTPLSDELRSDRPDTIHDQAMLDAQEWSWKVAENLEYSIRTGKSAMVDAYGMDCWEYCKGRPEQAAIFGKGMANITRLATPALVQAYDFSACGTLVDLGGGQGGLLRAILVAYPGVKGILFDLHQFIEQAREQIEPEIRDRLQLIAGDFFTTVPEGGDAYILRKVIHGCDNEDAVKLLRKCRQAMKPDGKILLIETIIQTGGGRETTLDKSMDLRLLAISGGGERTSEEFAALYESAGFKLTQIIPAAAALSIIEGVPV